MSIGKMKKNSFFLSGGYALPPAGRKSNGGLTNGKYFGKCPADNLTTHIICVIFYRLYEPDE